MTSASLSRVTPTQALSDEQVFRLLYAATFVFFLAAVVVMRLARALAGRTPVEPAPSLLAEAKRVGSGTLLFAFMG